MKITIYAVGKVKTKYLDNAIDDYQKRLKRWVDVSFQVINSSNKTNADTLILTQISDNNYVILLDETGIQLSTIDLANKIEEFKNNSLKNLVFIIGGSYGVSNKIRSRANMILSLSRLVFPHELVRLLLIEQLYRVHDLNSGGKYHHE